MVDVDVATGKDNMLGPTRLGFGGTDWLVDWRRDCKTLASKGVYVSIVANFFWTLGFGQVIDPKAATTNIVEPTRSASGGLVKPADWSCKA